ncbi:MAG: DUF2341 domain-containing protein [Thermoleophilia bacterium]
MHSSVRKIALPVSALMLFASFIFADTWEQTTTADFNTAGSAVSGTQVISDSVRMSQSSGWWQTPAIWWNSAWQNSRPITVNNNSGGVLTGHQVLVEPFRDSGDSIGDNLNSNGLVASWSFSEGTGVSTVDASGNNYNGTVAGATWNAAGRFGNSLSFSAVGDKVQTSAPILTGTGDFTVAAWICSTTAGDVDYIQGNYGLTNFGGIEFYINTNKLNVYISSSVVGSSTLNVNTWYYVAATRSSGAIKLYVNGVQDGSGTLNGNITSSLNWTIGNGPDYTSESFEGMIDEPMVFNRALSAEEIAMRYGSGLVGSWHFSEASGTATGAIADMSGYTNNGTLTNMAGPNGIVSGGKFGNAISFDGSNDYVSIPNATSLNLERTNAFAFETWVKLTDTTTCDILGKMNLNAPYRGIQYTVVSGQVHIYLVSTWSTNTLGVRTNETVNDDRWHHIVTTYDGSSSSTGVRIYIDGIPATTVSLYNSLSATILNSENLTLGMYNAGASATNAYAGLLDEVRIYNRNISAAEVSLRYNSGLPKVRHDFADVRFTTSDSAQELSFWQETDTRFWVETASLGMGDSQIRMYYGNPAATASSSGADTFSFFDHFEGTSLDTANRWDVNANMLSSVSNSVASIWTSVANYYGMTMKNVTFVPSDKVVIETKFKKDGASESFGNSLFTTNGSNSERFCLKDNQSLGWVVQNKNSTDGGWPTSPVLFTISANTWYIDRLEKQSGDTFKGMIMDSNYNALGTSFSRTAADWGDDNWGWTTFPYSTTIKTHFDWIRVRKYSSVELTHTAPGAESSYYLSKANGGTWKYNRSVAVNNNSGALTDYQMMVEPLRDTGEPRGDSLSGFGAGLVGSWTFSEGAGGTTADSSGSNTGTLNGPPTWTNGRFGNGLSFDGTGDYVALTATSIPTGANPVMSIEAWVNNTGTTGVRGIVGIGQAATNGTHVSLCIGGSGSFAGAGSNIWVSHWGGPYDWNTGYALSSGWHHIVYVSTGAQDKVYVDGVLAATQTVAFTVGASPTVRIGSWDDKSGSYYYFIGTIDEVNVYSRVLTAPEIGMRYGSSLVGSWHFSEGVGTAVADTSGSLNNGTLSGAPTWITGRFGSGMSFSGSSDVMAITSIPCGSEYAIETWFLSPLPASVNGNTLTRGVSYDHQVYIEPGSKELGVFDNQYGTGWRTSGYNTTALSAGWHHLVASASGTSTVFYIDGAYVSTSPFKSNAQMSYVGNYQGGNQQFGTIDEMRIYSRALSATEVAVRYNSGTPKYRHDLADIRFTNSDSTQEYHYWQQTDTKFWVEIPSLVSGASALWLFYGNVSASGASSWNNTFMDSDIFAVELSAGTSAKGLWPFSEGSGSSVSDSSGNVNTGTTGGLVTWATSGRFGNSLNFSAGASPGDGGSSGSYVTVNNSASLNITGPITLEAWIKPTATALSGVRYIVCKYDDSTNWDGYTLSLSNGKPALTLLKTYSSVQFQTASNGSALAANQWYHVAATYDGSTVVYYVNGVQHGSTFSYTAGYDPCTVQMRIGGHNSNATYYKWDGRIDEVRISNVALSSAQIMNDAGIRQYSAIEPTHSAPGAEVMGYSTAGTYTSPAKTTAVNDSEIDEISWTTSGPGIITMQIRAGNTAPAGWTDSVPAWEDVDNGDTTISAIGRYIQYRATFTGGGTAPEPVLADVTIVYYSPIIPPDNSVSCARLANTWYSTPGFVFTNDLGFSASILKYHYVWNNSAAHVFDLSESVWTNGDLTLNATTSDTWYMHSMAISSTGDPATSQDLGPFKFDGTAPPTVSLSAPAADENVTDQTPSFSWGAVVDTSGVTYTLQIDKYTSFIAPVIEVDAIAATSYGLSGSGTEFLVGNTTYYWRVKAVDGAGNASASSLRKLTTSTGIPQVVNSTTGVAFPDVQSAIDGAVAGDMVAIGDSIAHDINLVIDTDITVENGTLAPSAGFAMTGQGPAGGEVLRNCVITAGGISGLALGQNLTIYGTDPDNPVVLLNSTLVNCVIKLGTTITDCTLENCFIEAAATHFVDVTAGDFHLSPAATDIIDKGANLSSDFTTDKDGEPRGINLFEVANFDAASWDIGAYEFQLDSAYSTPGPGPATPPDAPSGLYPIDGTEWLLTDVTVTWFGTGALATGYTVEWGTDPAFASGVTAVSSIVVQSYNIESIPKDVIIYWRVKASNTYGDSAWSDIASFSTNYGELSKQAPATPAAVYPAADATGVSSDTVFMWEYEGVALATSYTVEWSIDPDMAAGLNTIAGLADPAYQVNDLPLETAVYWHAKALNAYGESEWSATSSFTTSGEALFFADPDELSFSMAANHVTPEKKSFKILCGLAGGEDWTVSVTDGWMTADPVAGSFADAKVSTIEVSVSPLGLTVGQTYVGAVTVALDDGSNEIAIPVYLEVTAADDGGDGGDGSGGETTDLQAPTLVSPADGQGAFDAEPYLVWASSADATGYIVQVAQDAEFTMISVSQEVSLTQYLPPALEKGANYYWRVKALNSSNISAWSSTRWFTLNPADENPTPKCFLEALFD